MEQTLGIIKPDAIQGKHVGEILSAIEKKGFFVRAMRMEYLSLTQAQGFYAIHKAKPFYESLTRFMSSGPCIVMVLESDDAIQQWRALIGPTDSTKAPPDTIRGRFGTTIQLNAVHGSDGPVTAKEEIAYFFPGVSLH